jgi:bifunctional DNA-binding transcriptional regulator/antitoxin component of YhaV-PrlF toxin-antitoxin module
MTIPKDVLIFLSIKTGEQLDFLIEKDRVILRPVTVDVRDLKGILKRESHKTVSIFQGYSDPFIRQRLMAEIFLSSATEQYEDFVMAGIVYTDKKYQTDAKPLNTFNFFTDKTDCRLNGCFQEIVLSDYTEKELQTIDPKRVILAPFTLSAKTNKTTLLAKGNKWQSEVRKTFPTELQWDALNILGLFILNRFRKITYEEVITMLNFDLMDTVAGKQLYKMGLQKGDIKAEKALRDSIFEVLKVRFGPIPRKMATQIRAIKQLKMLKNLHGYTLRCPNIDSFQERLS